MKLLIVETSPLPIIIPLRPNIASNPVFKYTKSSIKTTATISQDSVLLPGFEPAPYPGVQVQTSASKSG